MAGARAVAELFVPKWAMPKYKLIKIGTTAKKATPGWKNDQGKEKKKEKRGIPP